MRVLYFSREYTPHDRRFLSALTEAGQEVHYLRLENHNQPDDNRPLPRDVVEENWGVGVYPAGLSNAPALVQRLRELLGEVKPDLVQAGPIQRCAYLVALAGFHPLISMSWGYDLLLDARRDFLWEWVTRYTLSHSDAFIGDCRTIRDLAIDLGMDASKVTIFPWGVDLDHFSPQPESTAPHLRRELKWDDHFVVIHTRGWAAMYGTEEFLLGFAQAADKNSELRLLLLGEGPQAPRVHDIISEYQLEDRVVMPGLVSRDELPDYYRAADLYVSASHSDGSSVSLLEAMACGTPVLLSDIPGNEEWVDSGEQGWFFPTGEVDEIAEGLLFALDRQEDLRRMGTAARRLVEERANWTKNFPKLLDTYAMVVNSQDG